MTSGPRSDGWSRFRMGRAWFYRFRLSGMREGQRIVAQRVVTPRALHESAHEIRSLIQEEVGEMLRQAR
jgi:hypothetical protein